ncbi:hypothetical protein YC2023_097973 [Brassica napus]
MACVSSHSHPSPTLNPPRTSTYECGWNPFLSMDPSQQNTHAKLMTRDIHRLRPSPTEANCFSLGAISWVSRLDVGYGSSPPPKGPQDNYPNT